MKARYTAVMRTLGLSLLVLALSPVTAPFSTIDLAQLFDGTAEEAAAVVQSKKASDDTAADTAAAVVTISPLAVAPRADRALSRCSGRLVVHPIPLRI